MYQVDLELKRYVAYVQALPVLTREVERELAERWVDKQDRDAADALVMANLRYVVAIAHKYRRYKIPLSDLVAEGNLGLLNALEKFQPALGNRFVTYASFWIRARIVNLILRSWSIVGTGSGALRSKMFFKLRRERGRLVALLGDEDAAEKALANKLGMDRQRVRSMLNRLDSTDVSLDAPVFSDGTAQLVDLLPTGGDTHELNMDNERRQTQLRSTVRSALDELDPRERFIAEQRIMADAEDELSLAEIGRRLGVSRERARQLELRAKRKLEHRLKVLCARAGQSPRDLLSAA